MTSRIAFPVRIGCAGWNVPKADAAEFPLDGSHLQRYSSRFNCVEINSSFYKPHQPSTYARWAESVPATFRFSVKLPRRITHDLRLVGVGHLLDSFFTEVGSLGEKLGCVLVQLPPSLRFERAVVNRFLQMLRRRHAGDVVLEPRHASWFETEADDVLKHFGIGRVAADPAIVPAAASPGGDTQVIYLRLHGSPKIYYSTYPQSRLVEVAESLHAAAATGGRAWCIFDNTALGAATSNALETIRLLEKLPGRAVV